jgi:PAS domain S-box-containing protein
MQRTLVALEFVVSTRSQKSSLQATLTTESRFSPFKIGFALFAVLASFALATIVAMRSNEEQARVDRVNRTEWTIASIDDRLNSYSEVLYGFLHFFEHGNDEHGSFSAMVERLDVTSRLPGVQVIGAAHLVDSSQAEAYTKAVNARSQNTELEYPEFAIYPDTQAPQILPIDYIEPQVGNELAFGLDFLSEPNYRSTANLARDTNLPAATAPITLDQEAGGQMAFLLMLPIYDGSVEGATVEELRESFAGVVYAELRMDDLINATFGANAAEQVVIGDADSGQLMFGDDPQARWKTSDTSDELVNSVSRFGRTWKVVVGEDPAVISMVERSVPFVIVGVGLLVAGMLLAIAQSMRSTRRRVVAVAAEMTEELNALNEVTSEAIVTVDDAGLVVRWNSGAERIFTRTAREMLGQPVLDLVPEAHREEFMAAAMDFKSDAAIRRDGLRRDGEVFPIEIFVSSWTAQARNFRTAFIRDITDRVADETKIRGTNELLASVLGAATQMSLIATDSDGLISVFNAGAEQMLGYKAAEMVGAATVFRLHDAAEVAERANELGLEPVPDVFGTEVHDSLAKTKVWTYIQKDGGRVPVELTVTPRYDGKGRVNGAIGVAVDITTRLAAEAAQQATLEKQQEIATKLTAFDRAKTDFVSTISHELRTPLKSIIGYVELLSESLGDIQSAEQSEMLAMIEANAQRQFAFVENILSLSYIQSGHFRVKAEQCDSAMILRSASEAVAILAADGNISIRLDVDDLPQIVGDPEQLERVFVNLLTNAVNLSPEFSDIEVTAVANESLVVRVTDHGIGIPADDQQRLFTPFFRSTSAAAYAIAEIGLGLAVAANIIDRHHGQIDLDSVEGSGTTVTVTLPLSERDSSTQSLQVEADEQDSRRRGRQRHLRTQHVQTQEYGP